MSSHVTFRIDSHEFDEAMRQYLEVTTRALPDLINKKALYIARGALRLTPSTSAQTIRSSLGQVIHKRGGVEIKPVKAGAVYNNLNSRQAEAPLAALIINARRGRDVLPGLYGPEMTAAIENLIGIRNRSRAFIKSGWIGAIRALQPLVKESYGLEGGSGRPVQVGAPKGGATPAGPGYSVKAIIENSASGEHETHDALIKYGEPALQQAFNNEAASMTRFVADRQFEEARKIGIKAFSS